VLPTLCYSTSHHRAHADVKPARLQVLMLVPRLRWRLIMAQPVGRRRASPSNGLKMILRPLISAQNSYSIRHEPDSAYRRHNERRDFYGQLKWFCFQSRLSLQRQDAGSGDFDRRENQYACRSTQACRHLPASPRLLQAQLHSRSTDTDAYSRGRGRHSHPFMNDMNQIGVGTMMRRFIFQQRPGGRDKPLQ